MTFRAKVESWADQFGWNGRFTEGIEEGQEGPNCQRILEQGGSRKMPLNLFDVRKTVFEGI